MFASSSVTEAQSPVPRINGGVGPAMAGSVDVTNLPQSALDFIGATFPYIQIVECEREFSENTYEVELSDGVEIEFDHAGEWLEVDAGRVKALPVDVVRQLLPDEAFKEIQRRKKEGDVESVKRSARGGYKVEIREVEYDDLRFNGDGRLTDNRHTSQADTGQNRCSGNTSGIADDLAMFHDSFARMRDAVGL